MRKLLSQLRTRLILGALLFLFGLTGAVILVVRDSLQFLARDMENLGIAQAVVESSFNTILQTTLLTIGYFAVRVIVGVVLASRALTDPIQTLVQGTRAIASGDLSARSEVKSSDELGALAESFNNMADSLQTRTRELMEANQAAIENARQEEAHSRENDVRWARADMYGSWGDAPSPVESGSPPRPPYSLVSEFVLHSGKDRLQTKGLS